MGCGASAPAPSQYVGEFVTDDSEPVRFLLASTLNAFERSAYMAKTKFIGARPAALSGTDAAGLS
eukprot:scaffold1181_cov387-Prasinococcus_capsulatus_cf.AAC.10